MTFRFEEPIRYEAQNALAVGPDGFTVEQERIVGVVEGDVVALVDNLLWAARELDAGRTLTVEGANYLCDAQDWLNKKGA